MVRNPLWARRCALAATAALAACGSSDTTADFAGGSVAPPVIDSIYITPSSVVATPGATVQLKAIGRDTAGGAVDLAAAGQSITWLASATVPGIQNSGDVAFVTLPSTAGRITVFAQLTATASGSSNIEATSAGVTGTSTITVTTARGDELESDSAPQFDRVLAEALDPEIVALVIQGEESAGPLQDHVMAVTGAVDLGMNVGPRGSDGVSELVAFAKGRTAFARGPDGTSAAWTTGRDVIDADPLTGLVGGGRTINVRVGRPPDGSLTDIWAEDQVAAAQELFDENRLGIELYYGGSFLHTRVDGQGVPVGVDSPSGACAVVDEDLDGDPLMKAGVANLYILWVPYIKANNNTLRGWACVPEDPALEAVWAARAIYISQSSYGVSTIAHEIAHHLALWYPYLDPPASHTTDLPGFTELNLMWGSESLHEAKLRNHLSLGQSYRMNFDAGSWLNLRVVAPGGRWTRDCQYEPHSGLCPALATDLGS